MALFTLPICSWILLNIATGISLTVPLQYRWWTLPAILIPAFLSFKTLHYLTFPPGLSELWGTITLIGLLHFCSLLYIKKWTIRADKQGDKSTSWSRIYLTIQSWIRMYKNSTNPRLVRLSKDDIVIPAMHRPTKSTAIHKDFSLTKPKLLFFNILLYILIIGLALPITFMPLHPNDFAADKQVYFRRLLLPSHYALEQHVTIRETLLRIWFTLSSFWTTVLLLDCIHLMLAIIFIMILRVDTPADWPDLFGHPSEAYTLGRFWTRFWHRVHLPSYSDLANVVINRLPKCLTQSPWIKKAITACLLLSFSGLFHLLTNLQLSHHCAISADLKFYLTNAIAVILESTLLQALHYQTARTLSHPRSQNHKSTSKSRSHPIPNSLALRIIGYIYVFTFLFWCSPKFYYPKTYCALMDQQQQLALALRNNNTLNSIGKNNNPFSLSLDIAVKG